MNRDTTVAIATGSLILGLIKTMDLNQQHKGSTIAYTTLMRKHITKCDVAIEDRKKIAQISHDAMIMLVEQFKDSHSVMVVATFVESLSYSFENELKLFFGSQYINLVDRFVLKQAVDSTIAKDSYELSDKLRDNIRKLIFDNLQRD